MQSIKRGKAPRETSERGSKMITKKTDETKNYTLARELRQTARKAHSYNFTRNEIEGFLHRMADLAFENMSEDDKARALNG